MDGQVGQGGQVASLGSLGTRAKRLGVSASQRLSPDRPGTQSVAAVSNAARLYSVTLHKCMIGHAIVFRSKRGAIFVRW